MQQAGCLLVSVGLWPFRLLGTVVETGERQWVRSPLLWGGGDGGDQGMEGRAPTPCSGPPAALMLFIICLVTYIPRLDQGNRRVITPPMTDPVMESELSNIFLCDCYIL